MRSGLEIEELVSIQTTWQKLTQASDSSFSVLLDFFKRNYQALNDPDFFIQENYQKEARFFAGILSLYGMYQDTAAIEPLQVLTALQGVFLNVPQRSSIKAIYEILSFFLQIGNGGT